MNENDTGRIEDLEVPPGDFEKVTTFIFDELECRIHSAAPDPDHDEQEGIDEAREARRAIFRIAGRFEDVLASELIEERKRQDVQWGGSTHDDEHEEHDWPDFIDKFTHRAKTAGWFINHDGGEVQFSGGEPRAVFETNMLKVAALAIAAIQSSRRKQRGA